MPQFMRASLLSLPPEIKLEIFKHIYNDENLAPYSIIHPSLTPIVESFTFRNLTLDAETVREDMERYFPSEGGTRWWRRAAVKLVKYIVTLRVPGPVGPAEHREQVEELEGTIAGLNGYFTHAIENVFISLHDWERDASTGPYSYSLRKDIRLNIRTERGIPFHDGTLTTRYYRTLPGPNKTIPSLHLSSIPKLSCISSLSWNQSDYRLMDPTTIIHLAGKLGGELEELLLVDGLRQGQYAAGDIYGDTRGGLAQAITNNIHLLKRLRKLALHLLWVDAGNEQLSAISAIPPQSAGPKTSSQQGTNSNKNIKRNTYPTYEQPDPLSVALNRLSTASPNLTTFTLTGNFVIGAELFWPHSHELTLAGLRNDASGSGSNSRSILPPSPFWPNLERLCVELETRTSFPTLILALSMATRKQNMPKLSSVSINLYGDSTETYVQVCGLENAEKGQVHRREIGVELGRSWEVFLGRELWQRLGLQGTSEADGLLVDESLVVKREEVDEEEYREVGWWRFCRRMWEEWVGVGGRVRIVKD
ncbi:hypothetical protein L211DRAFT_847080 [Terfezia boudieri ATCC MYA-4762]|uniref:Uncharacterized protein n=1 Tax=Terfezia boudieri ATCC MYA-4762 TaxID=1051890 RepID=A0A3N4LUF0_9PEZI|nr:hypothetical protein L211DRAFT_847080 [Terfezia boudieri ATCC MYA-4762]